MKLSKLKVTGLSILLGLSANSYAGIPEGLVFEYLRGPANEETRMIQKVILSTQTEGYKDLKYAARIEDKSILEDGTEQLTAVFRFRKSFKDQTTDLDCEKDFTLRVRAICSSTDSELNCAVKSFEVKPSEIRCKGGSGTTSSGG